MTSDFLFLENDMQRKEYQRVHKLGMGHNSSVRAAGKAIETYNPENEVLKIICREFEVEYVK